MNDFNDGFLRYETDMKQPEILDNYFKISQWDDGYIAYSNLEKRIHDPGDTPISLTCRIQELGFVTEINVWRYWDGVWEELVFEREDQGYFMQHWTLSVQSETRPENSRPCYWRRAQTLVRKPLGSPGIFSAWPKGETLLNSREVICPVQRLHFFLTTGESDDLSARRVGNEK